MTRPKSNTVDYFPHDANQKRTLRILKSKWGSDGYAFWFQLLEQLCITEDHFIDLSPPGVLEDLAALTGIESNLVLEILAQLAFLGAINPSLWDNYQVIWSQNLVDRVESVYKNRGREKPKIPVFTSRNPTYQGITTSKNPTAVGISTPSNPQSKVKYSKVKYNIKSFVGSILKIPLTNHEKFIKAYPGIDLRLEYEKMDSWLLANPNKNKKNYARFANNWLNKIKPKEKSNEPKPYIP